MTEIRSLSGKLVGLTCAVLVLCAAAMAGCKKPKITVGPSSIQITTTTDGSFGGTGIVTLSLGSSDAEVLAVLGQPDGKVVAVGRLWNGGNFDFLVVRLNADGSLDASFDGDGIAITPIGAGDDVATAVAVQFDGKLIVAGYSFNGANNDFALARYTTAGALDPTFSGDGLLTTAIGASQDEVYALAYNRFDGRITVAGRSWNGTDYEFALAQYNSFGTLNPSFDTDGRVVTSISLGDDQINAIALREDNKIVVAGYATPSGSREFALARYNTNGSLDTTFSVDGIDITSIGPSSDEAGAVIVYPNGNVVSAGTSNNGSNADFALVRHLADGSLDSTFDGDGKATASMGMGDDIAVGLAVRADCRILVAGYAQTAAGSDFCVAAFTSSGALDGTFDNDGRWFVTVSAMPNVMNAADLDAHGRLLMAGYVQTAAEKELALVRVQFLPSTAIERASLSSAGTEGNANSWTSSISGDGRYIAFVSAASNLIAGDFNAASDIFLRDRLTNAITRVSVATGGAEGNAASNVPAISADGMFVGFFSSASNLVPGDTNGTIDVFLHERQTGITTRISVNSLGIEANGASFDVALSSDGRYVAFASDASNLVVGDTNSSTDVFLHDRQTGVTTRVSVATGGAQGNGASRSPAISYDGRYVAFQSSASDLVSGDANAREDVFVHDTQTGDTTRVSVGSLGTEGNQDSFSPAISGNGRYVAFTSRASNLVAGDSNATPDTFVHDTLTGETSRVSVATDGTEGNGLGSFSRPAISQDGRYVAFISWATSLVACDRNGEADIFVRDHQDGTTIRASVGVEGGEPNGDSFVVSLSSDGSHVAFYSEASNLVLYDTNGVQDVFVVKLR